MGDSSWNNPTNLIRNNGSNVRINQVFNLNDRNSILRDYPLFRIYNGKNDVDGIMEWDYYMVSEYIKADSNAWGMQLFWSERAHGLETAMTYNDHWAFGYNSSEQTSRDNVDYQENKYKANQSYPAFYNHRLSSNNNSLGDDTPLPDGTVGDNWGTWGGYHDWNTNSIVDETSEWKAIVWLLSNQTFLNDNCPSDSLKSGFCIRKSQNFKPISGSTLYYSITDSITNDILQSGQITTQENDLVCIDSMWVYKSDIRKVCVRISLTAHIQEFNETFNESLKVYPNPVNGILKVDLGSFNPKNSLCITNSLGQEVYKKNITQNIEEINLTHTNKSGFYILYILDLEENIVNKTKIVFE